MLKKLTFFLVAVVAAGQLQSQDIRLSLFGGMANYNGDLQAKMVTFQQARYTLGAWVSYDLHPKIMLRGGLHYANVQGADKYQTRPLNVLRNLSFATHIWELHAAAEYHFLGMDTRVFSPYVFAGAAAFHYNPYAFDAGGNKVFLKPLSTEGQGLSAYPDRKPYSLVQLAIPLGLGVRMALTDKVDIGAEFGYRKTFADYIDDVSLSYIDQGILFTGRGQKSVEMAFRTPELPNHATDPYPVDLEKRGSPTYKDNYYFFGLTFSYRLTGGDKFNSGRSGGKKRSGMGCPTNVL
jgi:hypothetical protein